MATVATPRRGPPTFVVVYCCRMDRTWRYLFEPVVDTLVLGARAALPQWRVSSLLLDNLSSGTRPHEGWDRLSWPDALVCIGPLACPHMPYAKLRARGVHTASYQTEPLHSCSSLLPAVDEVWDFSWHNLRACHEQLRQHRCHAHGASRRESGQRGTGCRGGCQFESGGATSSGAAAASGAAACSPSWRSGETACDVVTVAGPQCGNHVTLRFVPLGALPPQRTHEARPQPLPRAPLQQQHHHRHEQQPPPLVFLGQSKYRAEACWAALREQLRPHNGTLSQRNDVWAAASFARLLGEHGLFVNLHKSVPAKHESWQARCGDAHNPVTFRFAKLLSEATLLLSERCDPSDEAELDGLVSFVAFDDLGAEYGRLVGMGAAEREALAQVRQAGFAARFAPEAIVRRAGIAAALERRAASSRA